MSTRKRRERDREAMRRRILDAAKQLFLREGFDNVSMRRIASRIEYSPAALYRYFKNKREILSVLREEGFVRLVAQQEASRQACPDPLERLRTGMTKYIRFALAEPDRYQLMFSFDCGQVDMQGGMGGQFHPVLPELPGDGGRMRGHGPVRRGGRDRPGLRPLVPASRAGPSHGHGPGGGPEPRRRH